MMSIKSWIHRTLGPTKATNLSGENVAKTAGQSVEKQLETIDVSRLTALDPSDSRRALYDQALARVPGGQSDAFTRRLRYDLLMQMAEQAVIATPEADVAECGCFKGLSSYIICRILQRSGFQGVFHIFDSFEGLSEFQDEDRENSTHRVDREQAIRYKYKSNVDEVKNFLSEFSFVKIYQGWIPDRFEEIKSSSFSLVSIDVDLFQPTFDSVTFFGPRLINGGMMYFDDYGHRHWPGATKAIDEALPLCGTSVFFRLAAGGAFLIK